MYSDRIKNQAWTSSVAIKHGVTIKILGYIIYL